MKYNEVVRAGGLAVVTLCRYGRVPAGTRVRGSFDLRYRGEYPGRERLRSYTIGFRFWVGDDPRLYGLAIFFNWTGEVDQGIGERLGVQATETDLLRDRKS